MTKRAIVLSQFNFDADPRHRYWSDSLRERNYQVTEIELLQLPQKFLKAVEVTQNAERISVFHWSDRERLIATTPHQYRNLLSAQRDTAIGKYLEQILASCALSLQIVRNQIEAPDVLVANDLIPALACKLSGLTSQYSIYDAQEFFTSSYDVIGIKGLSEREKSAWDRRESTVVSEFTKLIGISAEGCKLMTNKFGYEFEELPNCVPSSRLREAIPISDASKESPIRYVFVGRAEPNRGLEQLVDSWEFTSQVATLTLYIPESSHKKNLVRRCRNKQLSGSITFPSPLSTSEMISEISAYDVGIVPYLFQGEYAYASPTKFGDYLAAGLPTLVSVSCQTVARIVLSQGIGEVADFHFTDSIQHAVIKMNSKIAEDGFDKNVYRFREQYVWDNYFETIFGESLGRKLLPLDSSRSSRNNVYGWPNYAGLNLPSATFKDSNLSIRQQIRASFVTLRLFLALNLVKRFAFVPRILSKM